MGTLFKHILFLVTVLAASSGARAQSVLISEFLASNDGGLADEDGDFEDWIELYNQADISINLGGWHLSDDPEDLARWRFPSVELLPGGYLVVFASGKDRRDPAANLHTNFKLKGSGEEIGLFDTDTTIIDGIAYDAQCPDVSSVRFPDGSETWSSTLSPTPGEANEFNPGPVYDIVTNEIFYNGDANYPDSTYEFFELYNNDVSTVDLSGYFLSEGVDFTFPDSSSTASDEYIVVTVDTLMYAGNGYQVFQWTDGALNNGGEDIQLMNTDCGIVDYVDYDDSDPWPEEADGNGPTLELINPSLDNTLAESWRASNVIGGTPGASNGGLNIADNSGLIPKQVSMLLYPNPFNPVTTISFSMSMSANVKIVAYNIVGNQVATILNQTFSVGTQSVTWNAKNRPSGVYFIRIESDKFVTTQKVILLK